MKCDPVAVHRQKTVRLLQFIREKGKDGSKLMEIWINLMFGEKRAPPACIISQLNRLEENGELIEVREPKPQGYLRRFYDLNFTPKKGV
jgi:hypothetical protein